MPSDILDNDRGVNSFGTPNYITYDVNRYGAYSALSQGTTQGFVGWVIRSYPTFYHHQADIYSYTSSSSFNVSTGAFAGELYGSNGYRLASITSDTTFLSAGTYYLRFASSTDQQYSINISGPQATEEEQSLETNAEPTGNKSIP